MQPSPAPPTPYRAEAGLRRGVKAALVLAVLAWLACGAFWSLTRERHLSQDSMIYILAARNWTAGRGIVYDILFWPQRRLPATFDFPQPYTHQPPLFPLTIAMLGRAGLDLTDAGLLIPVLAYGAILALAAHLMSRLYDERTALVSVLFLMAAYPMRHVASVAWSEPLALLLLLLSLAVGLSASGRRWPLPFDLLAGLLAGLAFATRYVFFVVAAVGLLLALVTASRSPRPWRVLAYLAGWLLPAAPVMWRSFIVNGSPFGTLRPRPVIPLLVNAANAGRVLAGRFLARDDTSLQLALFAFLAVAFLVWLATRPSPARLLHRLFVEGGRFVFPLWTVLYASALLWVSTQVQLNLFDTRLIAPAVFSASLMAAAVFAEAAPIRARGLAAVLLAVSLGWALVRVVDIRGARRVPRRVVRSSERLWWVFRETTPADLLVGDDAHDLAFHFDRRVITDDSFEYLYPLGHANLRLFIDWLGCERYANVYIVLHRDRDRLEGWRRREPFLADLAEGRLLRYPEITEVARLEDGQVLRWTCPSAQTEGAGRLRTNKR